MKGRVFERLNILTKRFDHRGVVVAKVEECLPSKYEALSQTPEPLPKKRLTL
jgi:hypothetical protein